MDFRSQEEEVRSHSFHEVRSFRSGNRSQSPAGFSTCRCRVPEEHKEPWLFCSGMKPVVDQCQALLSLRYVLFLKAEILSILLALPKPWRRQVILSENFIRGFLVTTLPG